MSELQQAWRDAEVAVFQADLALKRREAAGEDVATDRAQLAAAAARLSDAARAAGGEARP